MSGKGTAVITGAGSGIGRALTALCASRGYDLALFDINSEELEEAGEEGRALGAKVLTRRLDVSDPQACDQAAEEVAQGCGPVSLVINNAGVALGGYFDEASPEDFRWLTEINYFGVVNMTRAFLPMLQAHPVHGQLVNVSSVFGMIAPAGQTAYCGAKFAVRGFSEALRHELQGTSVGVTVVHPGGVATNIAKRARISKGIGIERLEAAREQAEKSLSMPPEKAAQIILDAAERRSQRCIVGNDARMLEAIQRVLPINYYAILKMLGLSAPPPKPAEKSTAS
ncbi:SDR family NAD(P)-dependent oxidoreductase [Parvularcula sp. ZS-1/3]|uniref:SDR family NAD(P)-dependent oxidoreductase n=1 Tax=Parvularcula mediterranea TaxID=2732508 RepID=A0A7Y3W5I0_9PROT|nr:SDR family NAD(P)-dependent oxidoreductase [Parvularcula mediterranea]